MFTDCDYLVLEAVEMESRLVRGSRSITTQIRRAIEAGTLVHGDQLPPERELSENYSASRSTIRKALDQLEEEGFVTRKVGSGTYVNYTGPGDIDLQSVIDQISPVQLVEARIGFERQMLRLAVAHANGRDIERMETILGFLEASEHDKAAYTQHDSEFHLTLAKASGNPLIVQLYDQINEVRNHAQWQIAREHVLTPEKTRLYNIHHRAIIAGLKNRSVVQAIDALNEHMDLAHRDVVGAPDVD